jgi:hypothetical protein
LGRSCARRIRSDGCGVAVSEYQEFLNSQALNPIASEIPKLACRPVAVKSGHLSGTRITVSVSVTAGSELLLGSSLARGNPRGEGCVRRSQRDFGRVGNAYK